MGPDEARDFVSSLGNQYMQKPANFEEQALKMMGRDLYETFFKGYTIKQWGCDPKELPASVFKRLPIRFNYDDNYYDKKHQGIPAGGYTEVIRNILDNPSISVTLRKRYLPAELNQIKEAYDHLFYTGPIDAFFDCSEGRLGYRTVTFERIPTEVPDYQGAAVINYPDLSVPWTRIHEHKYFAPWEEHAGTAVFREYSRETGGGDPPYYPKRLAADKQLLNRYRGMALAMQSPETLSKNFGVTFLGRLATYRYMDMEAVIGEALQLSRDFVAAVKADIEPPVFPNME
jgi:UDP-galactopyranose mutase